MTLSARDRLEGKITELQLGGVMAHVVVKVGDNLIDSVITKRGADEMNLKVRMLKSVTVVGPQGR